MYDPDISKSPWSFHTQLLHCESWRSFSTSIVHYLMICSDSEQVFTTYYNDAQSYAAYLYRAKK